MIRVDAEAKRELKTITHNADLVVVGGGMAGTCCAITAAREGLKVVLVQDRPVLGGNASSEVRLWVLGATSHMGSSNRWAREGGVHDEILVENFHRNAEGSPLIFDALLLEKVVLEPNITLLLNSAVYEVIKRADDPDRIESVTAFCSQNSTRYVLNAPLFADCSGDGIVGFLAGAAFRMGAEKRDEFNETYAPSAEYGELLGHSIYFYSKDVGHPVKFVPPSFAIKNVPQKIPRFRAFNANTHGCQLWWIEFGGRLDTVHDTETIKWELWKVVYGVWDYIKNSGDHPDSANRTLEWVGMIPGKRESRRFEGDYMLTQNDVINRPHHPDAVAFGGWSIDLHPADGVFSERPGSNHRHARGVYTIPLRCLYSRNISNLFLAGRIISSSHVAFGSTRVMGTGAHCGQAVAVAAAVCRERSLLPRDCASGEALAEVQLRLHRTGQHIPNVVPRDPKNLAERATARASSSFDMRSLPPGNARRTLAKSVAQLIPMRKGPIPAFTLVADVAEPTDAVAELRVSQRPDDQTPDRIIESISVPLQAGLAKPVRVAPAVPMPQDGYLYVTVCANPHLVLHASDRRVTGLLSVINRHIERLSEIGYEDYPVFNPDRRPGGQNLAIELAGPVDAFSADNVLGGYQRSMSMPGAWVASPSDPSPAMHLEWPEPQRIGRLDLFFDPDYDHALESVLMVHPDQVSPYCVKAFRVLDDSGAELARVDEWHQARWTLRLDSAVQTRRITIEILSMHDANALPSLYQVRAYA